MGEHTSTHVATIFSEDQNELLVSLLSSPKSLESELELLPHVFELLFLETNHLRLQLYLKHLKEFLEVEETTSPHVLNQIHRTFDIALGCSIRGGNPPLSSEELLWNGALQHVSQHHHPATRVTVVEILDTYFLFCIRCNQRELMMKVRMILFEMVSDVSREVILKAAKALLNGVQHCTDRNIESPLSRLPCECVISLLTFHGGRGGTRFGPLADRKVVYNIFQTMNFSNLATFSLVITSLQKFHQRLMASESSFEGSNKCSELKSVEHCMQSVIQRHKHFNVVRKLLIHSQEK